VWDIASHNLLHRLDDGGLVTNAISISPDSKWAAVSSDDFNGGTRQHTLVVWNLETGTEVSRFEGHQYYAKFQTFTPDGRYVLSGSFSIQPAWDQLNMGDVVLWEAATGREVVRFDYHDDLSCVDINTAGIVALVGSASGTGEIGFWDIDPDSDTFGELIWLYRFESQPSAAMDCQFSRDEQSYFVAYPNGRVDQRDIHTDALIQQFSGHEGWVFHLDISPDGKQLITAGNDGLIILWDIATGQELNRFRGHTAGIWDLVFSPDGQYAFSSSYDHTVLQWRITDWPLDELLKWVHENRYIRDFTCEERETYRIEPLCE